MSGSINDTVAIIGPANAGKSTLFNALAGEGRAIVSPGAGTTRDWQEAPASLGGLRFNIVDTLGVSERTFASAEPVLAELLKKAAAIIFLVDGQTPLAPGAKATLDLWRKSVGEKFIPVVNKCDKTSADPNEAWRLGLGPPLAISAAHKDGFAELARALGKFLTAESAVLGESEQKRQGLRVTLLGRPNVGKSTLANRFFGSERMATSTKSGTTTDSVLIPLERNGNRFELVDTAGIKRRYVDRLEASAALQSRRALRLAEVVVVLFEPGRAPAGDMRIMQMVRQEGRAPVAVLNKCDTLAAPKHQLRQLKRRLEKARFFEMTPLACSAKSGIGCEELFEAIQEAAELWRRRISTAALNRWLKEAVAAHPPPMVGSRRPAIRFISQIKSAPPTFLLSASASADKLPASYLNYLESHMRRSFGFKGTPLRFRMQEKANPYGGNPNGKGSRRAKTGGG